MFSCPNQSIPGGFHIVAFSASLAGHLLVFIGVLLMYLMTILGNVTIITLVCSVTKLHTPMYFFLCNLSFLDVLSTSSIIPKFLLITLTQDHTISFHGCITQLFFFMLCGIGVLLILTSMAYDRYVAICRPLQYYLIMSKDLCVLLAVVSWLVGILNASMHTILTSLLLFCNSWDINNFFCELSAMISISSSDTTSRKLLISFEDLLVGFVPFFLIILSYVFIISNIMKIKSKHGRLKAFSSCTSHLLTVILFGGPAVLLYIRTQFSHEEGQDKLLSVLFLIVVPLLNPLVYSLRNKDIWEATAALEQPFFKKLF
ncbi:olfactory receptor 5V1-like [Pyxicephalus adspersus]|uniref:G-protein coupled receptors family 1 profile domain-containing protein n=1 Tax=Pyxicephalus adspersus TaxID=30357 RepID=A0AAV3AEE1_PYXAD|nr:TPA: hypothetical protein GDO54_005747 [Pyxicephalus adspersus]